MRDMAEKRRETSATHFARELPENLVFGRNAIRELLASGRSVDKVMVARGEREGSIGELIRTAREAGIPVLETERSKLDALTQGAKHQGILAFAAERAYASVSDILAYARSRGETPLIVVLDGVEDPHNLGAILRTADCVGAHGVIIPKRRAVGLTPVVAKCSAGAIEHVLVARVPNLVAALDELKEQGVWVYAADMDGQTYTGVDLTGSAALVLGAEGAGVSRLVREHCDFTVSVPLFGHVDSLNVSNAAAVLLYEAVRQRAK